MSVTANPYAVHIGTRQPRDVIETTALELRRLAERIGETGLTTPRAPGKWSARDILCHLADSEIVFAFRLRQTLAEDHHVIQPFDQERWAPVYRSLDAYAAVATFDQLRKWNLALLETVKPSQLSKPVMHPERGEMTFDTIVETMAGHDLNHVKQLEEIASGSRSG
jgi:hypothetical protein